jgi:hypothetical protein
MIDGLAGVKSGRGTVIFVRGKCRTSPNDALGAQNKGELVYMLVCPKCSATLGEWDTLEARDKELRDFATKVQLLGEVR